MLADGWGTGPFTWYSYYFWIPLIVPHFGCVFGALLYELYAGFHFPYWIIDKETGTARLYDARNEDGNDGGGGGGGRSERSNRSEL